MTAARRWDWAEDVASIADHRTIARIAGVAFEPMTIENRVCDDAWWHNISFDEETGKGSYLMMFAAGACSNPHRHLGMEEFYVLEGELVDCDGQVYAAGDFVSLRAGSQHFSTSPGGCKLIVTHHGRTRTLTQEEWAEVEWTAET